MRNAKALEPIVLRRDGTKYDVEVLLAFDGEGNFSVEISVDDKLVLVSAYQHDSTFASVKTVGNLTVINPVSVSVSVLAPSITVKETLYVPVFK